jgi:L-ascorbate metabolism protein UlaG (beta-lactamase superfamily)
MSSLIHSTLPVPLLFILLLLSLCNSQPPAPITSQTKISKNLNLTITYIGNEGALISSGDKQVLIDGLHREYKPAYDFPPPALLASLESAKPPYNEVDLVLVSHMHLDHFHPESVGRHLFNNPKAVLVSSQQVVDSVAKEFDGFKEIEARVKRATPEWKNSITFNESGIKLRVLGLRHSGERFVGIQNLGHLIEINGVKLLHIGDADISIENFSSFRLDQEGIDIAFIPFWYLSSDSGRSLVRDHIKPKQVIAVHVSPADASDVTEQIKKLFPDAITFTRILESQRF